MKSPGTTSNLVSKTHPGDLHRTNGLAALSKKSGLDLGKPRPIHDIFRAAGDGQISHAADGGIVTRGAPLQAPILRPRGQGLAWLAPALALTGLIATQAHAGVCCVDGKLRQASQDILSLTAAKLYVPVPETWSVEEGNDFAQRNLLRPKGQERLSDAAVDHYRSLYNRLTSEEVNILLDKLQDVGLVGAIEPPEGPFDYILLNGSTAPNVRRRIQSVADAVVKGALELFPTTKIIFLDGERPLFASETAAELLDPSPYAQDPTWVAPAKLPQDERLMDEMLWQQMLLPKTLRQHGILFVHAQKQEGAARAETADCVAAWVKAHHPTPGRALVVSNNPTIEYQKRVTEILLAKSGARNIEVECMGPEAELGHYEPEVRLGLLLDAFAGTLFRAKQEIELRL